jgi:hypothetical protein
VPLGEGRTPVSGERDAACLVAPTDTTEHAVIAVPGAGGDPEPSRQAGFGVDGDALLCAAAEVGEESSESDEAVAVGDDEDAVR